VGASHRDTLAEVSFYNSTSETLILKNTRVNPSSGINLTGFNQTGNYLVSYNQDFSTGTVRVYGDYTVTGSTLTLDYNTNLYASTATAPKQMAGTNAHSAVIKTTYDAKALSQLITVAYKTSDSLWHVNGSVTGADMITFSGNQTNLDVTGVEFPVPDGFHGVRHAGQRRQRGFFCSLRPRATRTNRSSF